MIMNKRFSTLLATVLVAGGLSANAQIICWQHNLTQQVMVLPM